jgi:hypothetical protein
MNVLSLTNKRCACRRKLRKYDSCTEKKVQVSKEINPARQRNSEKTNSMHTEKEDPGNTNSHAGKRRALEVQDERMRRTPLA